MAMLMPVIGEGADLEMVISRCDEEQGRKMSREYLYTDIPTAVTQNLYINSSLEPERNTLSKRQRTVYIHTPRMRGFLMSIVKEALYGYLPAASKDPMVPNNTADSEGIVP